ncbi:MAG: 50S ribosomal protein L23 [Alphaproteobacteria bacterium]|jgi:large subunit ribosomal protein L23
MNSERKYDVILAPVVTEKSTQGAEYNQLTFRVTRDATKREIKAGIEELFGVKVTKVNTLNMRGKIKRFRGRLGKRADYKKAIVTLAEGERIDITTGI